MLSGDAMKDWFEKIEIIVLGIFSLFVGICFLLNWIGIIEKINNTMAFVLKILSVLPLLINL